MHGGLYTGTSAWAETPWKTPCGERNDRDDEADCHIDRVAELRPGRNPKGVMVAMRKNQTEHHESNHGYAQEKECSSQKGARMRSIRKKGSATPEYR